MRPATTGPLLTLLVAGCGADTQHDWTTAVDTLPGGTVVVTHSPAAEEAGPSWVLEEELRIGSEDDAGPTVFAQIKGVAVTGDGRIVTLESQAQEIRIFSADGAHLATYGRRGGGPGELQNALGLMQTSTGLIYVPDQRNARMQVLHPDSGFLRSYPLGLYSWGFVWNGAVRGDDHILVPSMSPESGREMIRVYTPDMVQTDSILLPQRPDRDREDPPGAFAWQSPDGRARGFAQVPFYPAAGSVFDRAGDRWSAFEGDPSYRIARWTPGGDTTLIVQTRRENLPVTQAERDSAVQAVITGLSRFGVRTVNTSKIPEVKPAILSLFTDDQDRLWVQTSSPDSLRRYDIYERDGRFAGTAASTLNVLRWLSPVVVGDRFYAVVTDELGVPYVVRARLVGPARDD